MLVLYRNWHGALPFDPAATRTRCVSVRLSPFGTWSGPSSVPAYTPPVGVVKGFNVPPLSPEAGPPCGLALWCGLVQLGQQVAFRGRPGQDPPGPVRAHAHSSPITASRVVTAMPWPLSTSSVIASRPWASVLTRRRPWALRRSASWAG